MNWPLEQEEGLQTHAKVQRKGTYQSVTEQVKEEKGRHQKQASRKGTTQFRVLEVKSESNVS